MSRGGRDIFYGFYSENNLTFARRKIIFFFGKNINKLRKEYQYGTSAANFR